MNNTLDSFLIGFQLPGMSIKNVQWDKTISRNLPSIFSMIINVFAMSFVAYWLTVRVISDITEEKKVSDTFFF